MSLGATESTTHSENISSQQEAQKLLDEFKVLDSKGDATLENVKPCPQRSREVLQSLPIEQRRNACREVAVGGRVLDWFWRNTSLEKSGIPVDRDFTSPLCPFLLPERRDRYIWD